jgi:hypothetical protein
MKRARVQHPLEYPCAVPSRTKTHAATECCAGVSAWHGPVHEHFSAQRDEPGTSQGFSVELARRHNPRRAVGAKAAEFPVRPPRARCRAVRLRALLPVGVREHPSVRLGPCSDFRSRTVSEAWGAARAPSTLGARCEKGWYPIGAAVPCVPWYVRIRSVRVVRPCGRAPRKCPFRRRARPLAARVRACESLVTFRVSVHVPWKVCAHCGTAGVRFVARA